MVGTIPAAGGVRNGSAFVVCEAQQPRHTTATLLKPTVKPYELLHDRSGSQVTAIESLQKNNFLFFLIFSFFSCRRTL
jgi:hypothetical protein